MSAKERILILRLTEKLERHPAYAKALMIEAGAGRKKKDLKGLQSRGPLPV